MIDLHSHILPGIDDGTRSETDALALARAAAEAGISTMAATPHLRADHPLVVPAEIAARCARLQELIHREAIRLRVVSGGEVDIHWAQGADDDVLRRVSYGGQGIWLLVETPYGPVGDALEELLFKITARGFRTLLAHPERNPSFQSDPGRLRALVERGTLIQITAHSLLDADRRAPTRRLAESLVRDSLAHVLASDAHRATGRRAVALADAARVADSVVPGAGRYLTLDAPAAVLAGEQPDQPPAALRRRRHGRLLRRFARTQPKQS